MEQFNQQHWKMQKLERLVERTQATNQELEYLNSTKDTFYDHLPIRFIEMI